MRKFPAVLILIAAGTIPALAGDDPALVDRGREVSVQHCSRCHVIDEENRFKGISSTPSFPLLVNALADWEERFESFQTRLPHPSVIRFKGDPVDESQGVRMVPVEMEYADIKPLVAYARSLKRPEN
jgi:Cytochrome c